jgi:imidazole glycerol-phosphate synthase subunit HisH
MSKTRIAIVDYEMGNLRSVSSALKHLGACPVITSDAADFSSAAGIILPGVGAFRDAALALERRGLSDSVREIARNAMDGQGQPFLGICLGLQLLFAKSPEAGDVPGLDLLAGQVGLFPKKDRDHRPVKVPHMGWNSVEVTTANPLTASLSGGEHFYFVHSYYAQTAEEIDTALACDYAGVRFAAMAARGNMFATQFHPEKSQKVGLEMLKAFVDLCK